MSGSVPAGQRHVAAADWLLVDERFWDERCGRDRSMRSLCSKAFGVCSHCHLHTDTDRVYDCWGMGFASAHSQGNEGSAA